MTVAASVIVGVGVVVSRVRAVGIEGARVHRGCYIQNAVAWCKVLNEELGMHREDVLVGDTLHIVLLDSLGDQDLDGGVVDEGAEKPRGVGVGGGRFDGGVAVGGVPGDDLDWRIYVEAVDKCGRVEPVDFDQGRVHVVPEEVVGGLCWG